MDSPYMDTLIKWTAWPLEIPRNPKKPLETLKNTYRVKKLGLRLGLGLRAGDRWVILGLRLGLGLRLDLGLRVGDRWVILGLLGLRLSLETPLE